MQNALDKPARIALAAEGFIRFDGPLPLFERTATADVQIGDVVVPEGQKFAALLGAANHDPAVFDAPERMDVTRDPNPHLGFGVGIHLCLGAPLARVEIQAPLSVLIDRILNIALAETPQRRPEFVIRRLEPALVTV